jgi:hypothetical protein
MDAFQQFANLAPPIRSGFPNQKVWRTLIGSAT